MVGRPSSYILMLARRLLGLLMIAALTPPLCAERVVFRPGWFLGAQFAGILVAQDQGYFSDAGLVQKHLRRNAAASTDMPAILIVA